MLILVKISDKVEFSFNPDNILSLTYFKSSIGDYWIVMLTYINGDSTEVKTSSEEVAQELIEYIARITNNGNHFIVHLEDIDDI